MKICFLNNTLNPKEGRGRYGFNLIDKISKNKDVEIIVLTEEGSGHPLEKSILLKSYLLRDFFNIFINAFRIRKYIKKCDIVHALDGYPFGVIAALANIGLKKKFIISGIGTYSILPLEEILKKNLLRWAYKKASNILCISNFTRNQILKRIKLNNTEVVNLGVDYEKFQIDIKKKRREGKIILSVGALKPRKGYHISIPAMAQVIKKHNAKYYIVCDKKEKEYIDLVRKHNIEKNVKFFYNISDKELIELYHKSSIFLLTPVVLNDNDFEGFGLVYLEANACGKPSIGTYKCGAEDAIIDNVTGFLVPQNDIKKTAEAVLKLLDNPGLAKKLGENGRKRAWEMNWKNLSKKYIDVYKKIVS
ncbi:glycosyltransferase family 4 protein [Patescibacteria group bacterium]|nr:glycosyltransferase family 4 protein [Patescibacteria group bacterium]